ncbi:MAG: expansin EXLX1 family cellulose-binding protein, partial [Chitinivibrionales bacterium]
PGDIDLGPGTFEQIADLSLGRVPITWRYCEAPIEKPLQIYWKEGSSRWHIEVQVRKHRYGITALEMKTQASDYVLLNREVYNFFKLHGGIDAQPGPYTIRITDIFDQQIVIPNIALEPEVVVETNTNFPAVSSELIRGNARGTIAKKQETFIISPTGCGVLVPVPTGCSTLALYSCSGKYLRTVPVKQNRISIPLLGRSIILAVPQMP